VLSGHVRELITEAGAAAAELDRQQARRDAVAAELADREKRAGQLREELERLFPALAAWQQADADLAESLRQAGLEGGPSPLESVQAELAGLGDRMSALDEQLRLLFAQHVQAYHEARRIMNLSGRGGSRQA
jgi:chromosome segregation ATPase